LGQWIDTWRPRDDSDTELGLILEDDISVSPYAYRWLLAVHRAYRARSDFVGTTLTSDQMSILSDKPKGPLAAPKNDTVLMYKALGAWGFSPRPLHWRRFQVAAVLNEFIAVHRCAHRLVAWLGRPSHERGYSTLSPVSTATGNRLRAGIYNLIM